MFDEQRSVMPLMEAGNYKTYQVLAPPSTHFRAATCAEVACEAYLYGWRTRVEDLLPEFLHLARNSGRKYVEQHIAEGETWLVFEAGQSCFRVSTHMVRLDRPELYFVRDGDWRGNPRETDPYQHTRPDFWVEDFAEHQQAIKERIERG